MVARDRIVIGASAGGVTALQLLVSGFPPDLRAAVFISLHMVERSEILLPGILSAAGPLPASIATDGLLIEEGRIYIAPPDYHLLLTPETIVLGHGPREGLQRPSINVMFRAAAAVFGERVIGVVLTGMLDDGAAGLWEIVQRGGVAVVQDPDEAAYRSMPESAIRGLNVQYILQLKEMAALLTRLTMEEGSDTRPVPDFSTKKQAPQTAPAIRQACPECGGAMTMEQLGGIKEYACHVGHRLGLQSMISDKTDVVERAMWKVLSQSEELIELLQQAQQGLEAGALSSVQSEIAARRQDMRTLRLVLERNRLSSSQLAS